MNGAIIGGIAIAVESGLEGRVAAAADRAGHVDRVAPDDRTRVGQARDRCPPQDVLAGRGIPGVGPVLLRGDAGCFATAKRRPVTGTRRNPLERTLGGASGANEPALSDRCVHAGRQPAAAIEDHHARFAVIGDQIQANDRSRNGEPVGRRAITLGRARIVLQGDLAAAELPAAGHRRPPRIAAQRERAGRIELQAEVANRQRHRRHGGLCCCRDRQ